MVRPVAQDLLGQLHAHAQARLVDVDIVDHRVRPCEIDVFEDAWRIDRIGGALPLVQLAVERDQYRLTGRDVVNEFVAERIERNRLRRDQIIRTVGGFALAIDDWTNAERIAEADDAVAGEHRNAGVGPAAAHMNRSEEHTSELQSLMHISYA